MAKYNATGVHKIHSFFSTSGGVLTFYSDNASTQIAYGESLSGVDVKFYGNTASAYLLWDESLDTLEGASSAILAWAGTASFAGVVDFTGSVGIKGALTVSATTVFQGNIIASGNDLAVNSASTKIGNASTDKVGFFGATAVVQQGYVASTGTGSTQAMSIVTALVNLGLMASA